MLTDSCVTFFFSPSRGVLSAILEDEYLTSVVGTKEEDKAGCNQLPPHDLDTKLVKFLPQKYWLLIHWICLHGYIE